MRIVRVASPGAFLSWVEGAAADAREVVLLPRAEVPQGAATGDELSVFVYLDSEDRPVATVRAPRLELGETAFLEVADVGPFGAFFDWGLPKNLLVPHAEQTRPLSVGDRHPISLYVDPSGRLAGTMRVAERVSEPAPGTMHVGDWVSGEAWRRDHAIGLFVLVERRWVGRLPADEPHQLRRGERASFRIAAVLPDGRLELSLRKTGGEQRDADAERVLAELSRPGALPVSEAASPEELRARFGLSKKAFKRAVGGLLRRGAIDIEGSGRIVPRRG